MRIRHSQVVTPQTVLRMSEKNERGRVACARFWTVALGQYAVDDTLADRYVEGQRDLLLDPATIERLLPGSNKRVIVTIRWM